MLTINRTTDGNISMLMKKKKKPDIKPMSNHTLNKRYNVSVTTFFLSLLVVAVAFCVPFFISAYDYQGLIEYTILLGTASSVTFLGMAIHYRSRMKGK